MRKLLLPLLLSLLLLHCKDSKKKEDTFLMPKIPPAPPFPSFDDSIPSWVNPLIERYIQLTDNEKIKVARLDTIPLTWIPGMKTSTDTSVFIEFQIGHSFEKNRPADGWLLIDSLKRDLYEYDEATKKYIPWKK